MVGVLHELVLDGIGEGRGGQRALLLKPESKHAKVSFCSAVVTEGERKAAVPCCARWLLQEEKRNGKEKGGGLD